MKKTKIPLESSDLKPISNLFELFETAKGFYKSRILLVTNKLNLFTIIGEEKLDAEEIAKRLGSDHRGTHILLDALVALGLLCKSKGKFSNGELAKRHLIKSSAEYKGELLEHYYYMWENWSHLEERITGKPVPRVDLLSDPVINEVFIKAMHLLHFEQALQYADFLNLKQVQKMMDLGGGGGSFSIAFAKKNPHLQSVVVDLPNTISATREIINSYGLSVRIALKSVDFFYDTEWDCGNDFDLVFISYTLHCENPEKIKFLLKKAYSALKEGGKVLINDYPLSESRTQPAGTAMFAVNMLVSTEHGNAYTQGEMKSLLNETGFKEISAINPYLTIGYRKSEVD